ncbi:hypothetical protein AB1Y20_000616 [Prymnesium parvum]|uniref:DUF202 domain-containing protein n=1 Tax=Prymnesium parvum TaxID=97485 RepID=A0AB34K9K4_PRYPA|mmetsp:Transcript_10482/g.15590  ORF Transcript_10482/g.15590 Transcript_10482/m.15590 type:complete len:113 (+) Transcript_10482:45-383(+)
MTDDGLLPVEPKIYFANERTFLHWMHAGVSLASVAMVVTAAGNRSSVAWLVSGTFLSILSIFLMCYAYRTFLWRAEQIGSRDQSPADDRLGPAILAGSLLLAILVSGWVVLV